jgi:methyl-accepting chemotaxis protein
MMAKLSTLQPSKLPTSSAIRTNFDTTTRTKIYLGAVILAVGFFRFFFDSVFEVSDAWLGRPGDSLLILVGIFLTLVLLSIRQDVNKTPQASSSSQMDDLLKSHLNLDAEIEKKLIEVVADTENSALKIINEVRQLYDSANTLVIYLDDSKVTADNMGKEIIESVEHLRKVEEFVQLLPAQMKSDLDNVQLISEEINALTDLVGAVKAISMQSHLLSINAAIEGSRAGPSGAAFRVVAGEMRKLASNSNEVANQINQGLMRANLVVTGSMATSISLASERLGIVLAAADSIHKFQANFTGITDFYKSRFTVITQHNNDLALNIAEVLGQIQYQDVVSQCIDRLLFAMNHRNAMLKEANTQLHQGTVDRDALLAKLDFILHNYLIEEEKHKHSARHLGDSDGELKIELF